MKTDDKKLILLVCAGNTCRSPMAKVILKQLLRQAGKAESYIVDSAAVKGPSGVGAST